MASFVQIPLPSIIPDTVNLVCLSAAVETSFLKKLLLAGTNTHLKEKVKSFIDYLDEPNLRAQQIATLAFDHYLSFAASVSPIVNKNDPPAGRYLIVNRTSPQTADIIAFNSVPSEDTLAHWMNTTNKRITKARGISVHIYVDSITISSTPYISKS